MSTLEDISDEEYFAELKLLFQSTGWQIMTAELQDNASLINNLQDVKDNDDLWYRKGQLASIGVLLNFEETIRRAEADADESS